MSHVTWHMSPVTCHKNIIIIIIIIIIIFFFIISCRAIWWRVCYHPGVPHLVTIKHYKRFTFQGKGSNVEKYMAVLFYTIVSPSNGLWHFPSVNIVHLASCVTCHMSYVPCHKKYYYYRYYYFFILSSFFGLSGGASRLRVCYQRGLLCLVSSIKHYIILNNWILKSNTL